MEYYEKERTILKTSVLVFVVDTSNFAEPKTIVAVREKLAADLKAHPDSIVVIVANKQDVQGAAPVFRVLSGGR